MNVAETGTGTAEPSTENRRTIALLDAIRHAQEQFIAGVEAHTLFEELQKSLLSITGSEYGFIGEVLYTPEGNPYLKTHAITNIAWDEKTREFYEKNAPTGMEFYNLKTLFGAVMTTGEPVISNDPSTDPRRGGLPEGHPPLLAFMGLPFYTGEKMVGMIGVANRPGGYDEEMAEYLRPLLDTCGTIIAAHRIDRQRIKAESEVEKAREFLQATMDGVEQPVMVIGKDYRITLMNKAAREYSETGEPLYCHQVFHGKGSPCPIVNGYPCSIEEVRREKKAVTLYHKHLTKWKETRLIEILASPLFGPEGPGGPLEGIIETWHDITERKRVEDALVHAKEEWERTFDTVPDLIAIVDNSYKILRANRAMAERLGLSPKEIIGLKCHECICGTDVPPENCPHIRLSADGKGHSAEMRIERLGGDFLVSVSPFYDEAGKSIGFVHVARDITARKEAERRLAASLKEKDALLREVHHRVKNNMQVISSLLRLQGRYAKDPLYGEMFRESIDRIRSMTAVHEKLYESRDLANVDFADYIKKIATGLFKSYETHPGRIALEIDAEKLGIGINTAIPCGLIINELISNSLKHAFPEGREGRIRISFHLLEGGEFSLVVSDNGAGISPELDYRNTKTLGLQLVMALVKQLGGRIELDRTGGTLFSIFFKTQNAHGG